ncbi:hypothetical protein HQ520_15630, partial [bacterium]|nr:hypothetical protein [bacterium]
PDLSLARDSKVDVCVHLSAPLPRLEGSLVETSQRVAGDLVVSLTTAAEKGRMLGLAAVVRMENLEGNIQGQDLKSYALVFEPSIQIGPQGRTVELPATSVRMEGNGETWLRADMAGRWDLASDTGLASATLHPVDRRLLNLAGAPQGIDFRDTKISGGAAVRVEQSVPKLLQARLVVQDLNPRGGALPKGGFPATDVRMGFEASQEAIDQPLVIRELQADIMRNQDGRRLVLADLRKPIPLDPQTMLPVAGQIGPEAFVLEIRDFDLAQWQTLIPAGTDLQIESGMWQGDLQLGEAPGQAEAVRLTGNFQVANLKGVSGGQTFGPMTKRVDLALNLDAAKHLVVEKMVARLSQGEKPLGTFEVTADMNLAPLSGKAGVVVRDLRVTALPFGFLKEAGLPLRAGVVNAKANANLSAQPQTIQATYQVTGSGLELAPMSEQGQALTGLALDVQGQSTVEMGEAGPQRLDIPSLNIRATLGQAVLAALSAQGSLNLARQEGSFRADIAEVDLVPLLAWQGAIPAEQMPREAKLQGHVQVEIPRQNTLKSSGKLEVRPLIVPNPQSPDGPPSPLRAAVVNFENTVDLQEQRIQIETASIEFLGEQESIGKLTATGTARFAPLEADLTIQAPEIRLGPLAALMPPAAVEKLNFEGATLRLDEKVWLEQKTETPSGVMTGTMQVRGLLPKAGAANLPPLGVDVEQEIDYRESVADLRMVRLLLRHGEGEPEVVNVAGRVKMTEAGPDG